MGLNIDRVKSALWEGELLVKEDGVSMGNSYFDRDNFEMFDDNLHGRLNHDHYEFTEMEKPPLYWILGPTKDGTVAEPTIKLDYRYNGRIFWINISTCSCIVQLPPVSECSIGTKFKFILNQDSESEGTKNFGIITDVTGTDINGYIGGGADIHIARTTSSVYWDTSDAVARSGDWCELITDGSGWYITGHAAEANSVDQAAGHDVTT